MAFLMLKDNLGGSAWHQSRDPRQAKPVRNMMRSNPIPLVVLLVFQLMCLNANGEPPPPKADIPDAKLDQRVVNLRKLRGVSLTWLSHDLPEERQEINKAYADLIFAYGFARLDEKYASRRLLSASTKVLNDKDEVHRTLLLAFTYRTEQALGKQGQTGPLPAEVFVPLMESTKESKTLPRYMITRMLEQSRILEPREKVDPYLPWVSRNDEMLRELVAIQDVREKGEVEKRLGHLLKANQDKSRSPIVRLTAMAGVLSLGSRAGQPFAVELLRQVGPLLDETKEQEDANLFTSQGIVLERALLLASEAGEIDQVKALAARSRLWLRKAFADGKPEIGSGLAEQSIRALQKPGLREEMQRLVNLTEEVLPDEKALDQLRIKSGERWPGVLGTLLSLASGQQFLGHPEKATPILAAARSLLLEDRKPPTRPLSTVVRTKLACAYVMALGQLPNKEAVGQMIELLEQMEKMTDTFSTNTHFSKSHLVIVEAMVLSLDRRGK